MVDQNDNGILFLDRNKEDHNIMLVTVIGEIEGHELLSGQVKSTKYEHILPILATAQDDEEIHGILMLINTVGGDCACGLALAEMIASIKKPVASVIIGDSHSIGVPLSVSADRTWIVPTATVVIHPVRLSGSVIGAPQTFDYFKLIQDRIVNFIVEHSKVKKEALEEMMLRKGIMTKDLGTILVGEEAVTAGIVDEVGGIADALDWLHERVNQK